MPNTKQIILMMAFGVFMGLMWKAGNDVIVVGVLAALIFENGYK